jgi:hypothetical protein
MALEWRIIHNGSLQRGCWSKAGSSPYLIIVSVCALKTQWVRVLRDPLSQSQFQSVHAIAGCEA